MIFSPPEEIMQRNKMKVVRKKDDKDKPIFHFSTV